MTEELREVSPGKKPAARSEPTMITVNGKQMVSNGRWNDRLMADYISENAKEGWLTVGHLAKVACGSNTIPTKKRVRYHLSALFMELRGRGSFLAIEYHDANGAASAVKIADLKSVEDKKNVQSRLDRMKRRKELTEDQYQKSMALLHTLEQ